MKLIFAGTPQFAAEALRALLDAKHQIVAVLTQPDRPAGRGMLPTASPVKLLAEAHGIRVLQPESLKSESIQLMLRELQADAMVVAAYGLILPQAVLSIPRLGCLNIHASLLPRWRGAAPIQRAILAGDVTTGITIMQMDAGLDTGDILLQRAFLLTAKETAQSLHDKLSALGAECIAACLRDLQDGNMHPQRQNEAHACYAAKISKAEARMDWSRSADELERAVRAYNPFPVAHTELNGTPLKIWQATADSRSGIPGTVLEVGGDGVRVGCGEGSLVLEVIQKPGGKALPASQFTRGFQLSVGATLGAGAS